MSFLAYLGFRTPTVTIPSKMPLRALATRFEKSIEPRAFFPVGQWGRVVREYNSGGYVLGVPGFLRNSGRLYFHCKLVRRGQASAIQGKFLVDAVVRLIGMIFGAILLVVPPFALITLGFRDGIVASVFCASLVAVMVIILVLGIVISGGDEADILETLKGVAQTTRKNKKRSSSRSSS